MKLSKHAWAAWGIALIVVIALMALIPFARTASWWIVACCTLLMFGLCACAFVLAFRKGTTLESKVLGWPIFKVGYTAVIAQIIVGAILMGIASFCPVWVTILVELLLFAGAGICLVARDAARAIVMNSEAPIADRTGAWEAIRSRANALAAASENPELRKLAEAIRYADPTQTSLDGQISRAIESLERRADADGIKKVFQLLNQRRTLAMEEKRASGLEETPVE